MTQIREHLDSRVADPPLRLRERKKIKLRRTIQAEALRLFETQGYEQTTVEQIAGAAETSMATFYRYFPTKEDVVLDDDYDPVIQAAFVTRPAGEALADSIRAVAATVVAAAEADRDRNLARLRFMASVPALSARYAGEQRRSINLLARLLSGRTGRAMDDYQLNITAAALVAALFTATSRWGAGQGTTPISALVETAITVIEPLLAALQQPAEAPLESGR